MIFKNLIYLKILSAAGLTKRFDVGLAASYPLGSGVGPCCTIQTRVTEEGT